MRAKQVGREMDAAELPEECWELVFRNLTQASHWQSVSLTCMQFLYISNRLRPSLVVGNACSTALHGGGLPRLLRRFSGLQYIDLSLYQGNLARPILILAHADLPKLTALSFQGQKALPTEAIEELGSHHRGLKRLNCSRFQVWQDSDLFTVARSFPLLEELDISYPQHGFRPPPSVFFPDPGLFPWLLTDAGVEIMASILVHLRSFNTSGHFMLSDYSLEILALRCQELTELTVFDCPFISDEGLKFLSTNCPNLETLGVNGGRVTPLGIENVISTSHNLHSLNLSHTVVTDGLVRDLAHCHIDLRKLVLAGCKGMSSAGLLTLAQSCPHMVHLDLEGAYCLMDEHMVVLAKSFPDLAFLRLNYCSRLTDVSFYTVLHNCKKLQELHMEGTGLGWGTLDANFPFQPRSHLTKLMLAWNKPIRDSTLGSIAKLCPSLSTLDLSHCLLITHIGLTAIGKGCPKLRELSLKGCKKVHTLGTVACDFNRLEYLELEFSSFTDAGLVSVSRSCRHLTSLGLHGCIKVTDAGLRLVMEECRELRQLNLKDCQGVSNEELVWMVFCRPTLRKLVLPSFTISKGQKSRLTRHGCELITHTN